MKKRAQALPIGAGILIVIGILILIFYIVPTIQQKVLFNIQLQNQKIIEGKNTILFYKITNNLKEDIEEVKLNFQIIGESYGKKDKEIGVLKKEGKDSGAFNIFSSNLDPGIYTLRIDLNYYIPSKQEKKSLTSTLQLEVIEEAI